MEQSIESYNGIPVYTEDQIKNIPGIKYDTSFIQSTTSNIKYIFPIYIVNTEEQKMVYILFVRDDLKSGFTRGWVKSIPDFGETESDAVKILKLPDSKDKFTQFPPFQSPEDFTDSPTKPGIPGVNFNNKLRFVILPVWCSYGLYLSEVQASKKLASFTTIVGENLRNTVNNKSFTYYRNGQSFVGLRTLEEPEVTNSLSLKSRDLELKSDLTAAIANYENQIQTVITNRESYIAQNGEAAVTNAINVLTQAMNNLKNQLSSLNIPPQEQSMIPGSLLLNKGKGKFFHQKDIQTATSNSRLIGRKQCVDLISEFIVADEIRKPVPIVVDNTPIIRDAVIFNENVISITPITSEIKSNIENFMRKTSCPKSSESEVRIETAVGSMQRKLIGNEAAKNASKFFNISTCTFGVSSKGQLKNYTSEKIFPGTNINGSPGYNIRLSIKTRHLLENIFGITPSDPNKIEFTPNQERMINSIFKEIERLILEQLGTSTIFPEEKYVAVTPGILSQIPNSPSEFIRPSPLAISAFSNLNIDSLDNISEISNLSVDSLKCIPSLGKKNEVNYVDQESIIAMKRTIDVVKSKGIGKPFVEKYTRDRPNILNTIKNKENISVSENLNQKPVKISPELIASAEKQLTFDVVTLIRPDDVNLEQNNFTIEEDTELNSEDLTGLTDD